MTSDKQRLFSVLNRQLINWSNSGKYHLDGPPVICPGGMMSMMSREIAEKITHSWHEMHRNPDTMAKVALALKEATGFENIGVPFCMTVEAEALGAKIDYGNSKLEPRVTSYSLDSPSKLSEFELKDAATSGRIPIVMEAISLIKKENHDSPIIGNLVGPISLATSIMEPNSFFRCMLKDKVFVHRLINFLTDVSGLFGECQLKSGADIIMIADPACGGIIGPELFKEFVEPSLSKIFQRVKKYGGLSLLHICGKTTPILKYLRLTGADAFSFDAPMSIEKIKAQTGDWPLMGNVSSFLLARGLPDAVSRATLLAINQGVDIVSPACGLDTGTPLLNIRAMTDTVRSYRKSHGSND